MELRERAASRAGAHHMLSSRFVTVENFGKYEIVEKIGEGGFGVVYRGYDPAIRRDVAIKACTSLDPLIRRRFSKEAEIAGNLQHRNITIIFDYGEEDGTPFLVQEYLSGEDLDRKIRRRDPMTFGVRLSILIQIARGLAHAHAQGVVHRDVKPGNMRVLDDGVVKIMDFGIARVMASDSVLTVAGHTIGTAAYLAPEQVRGDAVDRRCDIYAFGILAYELLSFQKAFPGNRSSEILTRVLNDPPEPLALHAPELPPALLNLVERCVQKSPEDRFRDFGQIRAVLDRLLQKPPADAPLNVRGETELQDEDTPSPPPRARGWAADGPTRQLPSWDALPVGEAPAAPPAPELPADPPPQEESPPRTRSVLTYGLLLVLMAGVGALAFWIWGRNAPEAAAPAAPEVVLPEEAEVARDAPERGEAPAASPPASADPAPLLGTVTVAAAADPRTRVRLAGQTLTLNRAHSLQLQPGEHQATFELDAGRYRGRRSQTLRIEAGASIELRSPVAAPARLTVRAGLDTAQFSLWVAGDPLGTTPIDELELAPGSVEIGVGPAGSSAPETSYPFAIPSGEHLILTFDNLAEPPTRVRSPG